MNIKLELSESFYHGEERCGYYVSPEMKKVWAVQLDLLAEFARVCEKHNIRWWADAGTLLGAVRHKGFIPWDHDSDVMMMRSEYERLLDVAEKEFTKPYKLLTPKTCAAPLRFVRLINEDTAMFHPLTKRAIMAGGIVTHEEGITLDIFPVDKISNDKREIKSLLKKLNALFNRAGKIYNWKDNYHPSTTLWKRPIKAFLHYVLMHTSLNYKDFFTQFLNSIQTYNQSDSIHVAKVCMAFDPDFISRRVWPVSDFDGTVYFPFEMLTLPAPSGWEDILTRFYGDWRKLVIRKLDERPESEAFFYDTEHSYTYYTQEGHPFDEGLA